MITLVPPRPLSMHLDRAADTAEAAQQQLHRVQMLEVARLIRDVFPQATSLVLDTRCRYVAPVGLQLHKIYSDVEQLWSAEERVPEQLRPYRTADGYGVHEVLARAESALTFALGADQPQEHWPHYRRHTELFVVDVPSPDDIDLAQSIVAGHLAAQLRASNDQGAQLWLAEPVRYPTMAVAGLAITTSIDDDGSLTVAIDAEDGVSTQNTGDGRVALDIRLNGISLTSPSS